MGGSVRGREGRRQYLETILRAFPDLKLEAEEIIASGHTVVTRVRMTATHSAPMQELRPSTSSCKPATLLRYVTARPCEAATGALSLPMATAAG